MATAECVQDSRDSNHFNHQFMYYFFQIPTKLKEALRIAKECIEKRLMEEQKQVSWQQPFTVSAPVPCHLTVQASVCEEQAHTRGRVSWVEWLAALQGHIFLAIVEGTGK